MRKLYGNILIIFLCGTLYANDKPSAEKEGLGRDDVLDIACRGVFSPATDASYEPIRSHCFAYRSSDSNKDIRIKKIFGFHKSRADSGEAFSQYVIGVFYEAGLYVERSEKSALYWYKKSSDNGCQEGQYALGLMFETGRVVSKNINISQYLFEQAASKNNIEALLKLATIHRYSPDGRRSPYVAMKYYERALSLGSLVAGTQLADMYERGDGVGRNIDKAIVLYKGSSDGGDSYAQAALAGLYLAGHGGSVEEALSLLRKSAEKKNPYGYIGLGYMYLNGVGVDKSRELAGEYFQKAQEYGVSDASLAMGFYFFDDANIDNRGKAFDYFCSAARYGLIDAYPPLGVMYAQGIGVDRSIFMGYVMLEMSKRRKLSDEHIKRLGSILDMNIDERFHREIVSYADELEVSGDGVCKQRSMGSNQDQ